MLLNNGMTPCSPGVATGGLLPPLLQPEVKHGVHALDAVVPRRSSDMWQTEPGLQQGVEQPRRQQMPVYCQCYIAVVYVQRKVVSAAFLLLIGICH